MRTSDTDHSRYIRRTDVPDPNVATGHTSGKVASGATAYFDISGADAIVTSIQLRWLDSATSGTFTVESTNLPVTEALYSDAAGSKWFPETLTITSPSAASASTFIVHLGNVGTKRLRVKYVAAADSEIEVVPFGVE